MDNDILSAKASEALRCNIQPSQKNYHRYVDSPGIQFRTEGPREPEFMIGSSKWNGLYPQYTPVASVFLVSKTVLIIGNCISVVVQVFITAVIIGDCIFIEGINCPIVQWLRWTEIVLHPPTICFGGKVH